MSAKEAEVRVICSFVAGAAGWKQGVDNASRVRLFTRVVEETSVDDLPSTESIIAMIGRAK